MKARGFSLIELLVSLTIITSLLALVGPLGYRSVERAKAQTELVSFQRWLDRQGHDAFIRGNKIDIDWVSERTVIASVREREVGSKTLENLKNLKQDPFSFSVSGIPSRRSIDLQYDVGGTVKLTVTGALSTRSAY